MNGFIEQNDNLRSFDAKLISVDMLIIDASAAVDSGDFNLALDLFQQALDSLKSAKTLTYVDCELDETEKSLSEIDRLLDNR